MALSLRKSLQEIIVFTDGYSATRIIDCKAKYEPTWSLEMISALGHDQFVQLCAGYFEEKGYRTIINKQHDEFIDIWLFKENYSSNKPFGIIKCWDGSRIEVDSEDFCQFPKIISKNNLPFGTFITAGTFSGQVIKNKNKKIKLIDGRDLLKLIESLADIRSQRLFDNISSLK